MNEPKELIDPATGAALVVPHGIFDEAIRAQVERAVAANVPPGKRGAVIGVLDTTGVRFGVAGNLDRKGDWKLAAEVSRDWAGPVSGKVMLFGSF